MEDMKKLKDDEFETIQNIHAENKNNLIDLLQDKIECVIFDESEFELLEDDIYEEIYKSDPPQEVVDTFTVLRNKIHKNIGGWCSMIMEHLLEDPEDLNKKVRAFCTSFEDLKRIEFEKKHYTY